MLIELPTLLSDLIDDLHHPDILWQLAALFFSLIVAKGLEGFVREQVDAHAMPGIPRTQQLGRGSLKRVIFPIAGLLSVMIARWLLNPHMPTHILKIAIPLLGSLAIIRLVFYILRHSFTQAAWLTSFERVFATIAWSIVALHILDVLPEIINILDDFTLPIGKSTLSLWQILQGMATVAATLLIALWLSNALEARINNAKGMDTNLQLVLARLVRALLTLLAVLLALPMVGIDLTTLSIFGGALGVGLGFGLQKIASNYVSGFIILLDNSIRIGNIISVGEDRGQVTHITTRFTVLRSLMGVEHLIPNELLISSVVHNESYSDRQVRIALPIQISYSSNLELAMQLLVDAAKTSVRVLPEPAPAVLLKEFADSGINLELGFWITDPENGLGILRSEINLAIWHSFKQHGITIPYPQREVRLLGENNG